MRGLITIKQYLEIGKIVNVVGLKGEVKVMPWCDTPELLCEFETLYYKSQTPVEIESARVQKNMAVLKIKGIDTVEDAQKLRNRILYMDRNDVELPEDTYFVQDLIGMRVIDADTGHEYGEITDVSETGANDVYHIRAEGDKMLYCPAIPDVVIETDVENGIMRIRPLKGLFDDED